jgi:hypothetical protein
LTENWVNLRLDLVDEGRSKIVLSSKHHTMEAYWESGGIALSFFDLGTRWR